MEREIEFRGKDIKTKEWHYGSLVSKYDTDACDYCEYHILEKYGYTRSCGWDSDLVNVDFYEVDENTLGQYVGLKDKNGNKIYEGDIVKTKYGRICKVVWHESRLCFDLVPIATIKNINYKAPDAFDIWYSKNLDVVGNIYDNKDLLD